MLKLKSEKKLKILRLRRNYGTLIKKYESNFGCLYNRWNFISNSDCKPNKKIEFLS